MRAHTRAIGLGVFLLLGCCVLPAQADEPGLAGSAPRQASTFQILLRRLFLATAKLIGPVYCHEIRSVKNQTIAEIDDIRREAQNMAAKARNGIASDRSTALAEYKAKAEEMQRQVRSAGPRIKQLADEWNAINEKYLGLLRKSPARLLSEIDRNEYEVLKAADDAVRSVERWAERATCTEPVPPPVGCCGIRG